MPLTAEEVGNIADTMQGAARAAALDLRGQIHWYTLDAQAQPLASSAHNLEDLAEVRIPAWRRQGEDFALDSDESTVERDNRWRGLGAVFEDDLVAQGKYARDARLEKVVIDTAKATAVDAAKGAGKVVAAAANLVPWYVYAGAGLAVVVLLVVVVKARSA